jgi:hypothetical protein
VGEALLYAGAIVVALWGVAHLIPTGSVVAGFGAITLDNRRVLTMEWVAEGLTMIFAGALIAAVTLTSRSDDSVAIVVYRGVAGLLAAIAVLTALTGARTPVGWFKACPVVLGSAIGLILVGSALA